MKNYKRSILLSVLTALILIFGISASQAASNSLATDLNLTTEQINKLGTVIDEFNVKAYELASKIDSDFMALEQELKRKDRLDSESNAKAAAKNVNKLVKSISSSYGDLLKLRVEYMLKAKDVFTMEQREALLSALLNFEMEMPDNFTHYTDVDFPALGLDLTHDQVKKLLKYRADMEIKEIKLALDMDYKLLDLQDEIMATERNPEKINKIIMSIIDIGTKNIDNQVDHILKSKDVLTLEQKRELMHKMMI